MHLIRVNDPQRHAGATDRVSPTPTRSTPGNEALRAVSITAVAWACRDIEVAMLVESHVLRAYSRFVSGRSGSPTP